MQCEQVSTDYSFYKIDLKDLTDSAILASLGRLFQCKAAL